MLKKFLAIIFVTVLVFALSVPAMAAPYQGGTTIDGDAVVKAVEFDTDDYNEFTADLAGPGNWTWYYGSRDKESDEEGSNYAHRPEYKENEDGPQTEAAEVGGYGEIGGICYTHGADADHPDPEWVQYTLNVAKPGKYDLKVWGSTDADDKSVNIYWNGALVGSPDIERKGWTVYNLFDVGTLDMALGNGILKLEWPAGDANIGAFEFTLLEAAPTEAPEETPADDGAAADSEKPAEEKDKNEDSNMLLWIIIAVAAVLVIIIIAVLVTKKKK